MIRNRLVGFVTGAGLLLASMTLVAHHSVSAEFDTTKKVTFTGTVKKVDGKVTLINIKYYPPDQISPPDGVKSVDWIRSGFKRK